jgi:hypothetical protein
MWCIENSDFNFLPDEMTKRTNKIANLKEKIILVFIVVYSVYCCSFTMFLDQNLYIEVSMPILWNLIKVVLFWLINVVY